MDETIPTVAYVAGYGRSGSTILDIILHAHPGTVSVGALHNYPRALTDDSKCGCGQPLSECSFWRDIRQVAGTVTEEEEFLATQLAIERRSRILLLMAKMTGSSTRVRYQRQQRQLLAAIASSAGSPIVVDSSKSAGETLGRPWALRSLVGADVRIIHLVRSPRSVLASVLSGSGGGERVETRPPSLLMVRTAIQWSLVNLSCLLLYRGDQVVRLRYEDLVAHPRRSLNRIGLLLELDLSPVADAIENGEPLQPGHNLGGNRLKHSSDVVVKSSVAEPARLGGLLGSTFDLLTLPARQLLRSHLA